MDKPLTVPVQFGKSITDADALAIGVTIEREHISLEDVDAYFSGRRLDVTLGTASDPDQTKFWDDLEWIVRTTAEVKGVRIAEKFTTRLVFDELAIESLRPFKHRKGAIVIHGSVPLPERDTPSRAERDEAAEIGEPILDKIESESTVNGNGSAEPDELVPIKRVRSKPAKKAKSKKRAKARR